MTEKTDAQGLSIRHSDGVVQVGMLVPQDDDTLEVLASLTPDGAIALAHALVVTAEKALGTGDTDVKE